MQNARSVEFDLDQSKGAGCRLCFTCDSRLLVATEHDGTSRKASMGASIRVGRARLAAARFPLMALAALSLLVALWTGLARSGWALPAPRLLPAGQHGAFMVAGFLGTLISIERAVALHENPRAPGRSVLFYLPPLFAGLGSLALLIGLPPWLGRGAITLGGAGLVLVFAVMLRLQTDMAGAAMALGAICWLGGNLLWLAGRPVANAVPWWAAFLVLTIAGERLELARILRWGPEARRLFLAATALFVLGLLVSVVALRAGMALAGAGLVALGLWLLRYDVARRTIRREGVTRYMAACLLPGYVWLLIGGLLWLVYGGRYLAGPYYDALHHAIFLGFVFSMIFGHAPVIIPSILGRAVTYRPVFYGHLLLLHLSLGVRIAGDVLLVHEVRRWGALFNVIAVLLFLGVMALSTRRTAG
jgi:hypothetical protein